eukprot:c20919_g1_i1.p4 GENE.c20919_g1_i1~~c20919_g1_i1.p4  ORF type:complete len:112 (-),score=33.31 c20919_g1_i1:215-550(-)
MTNKDTQNATTLRSASTKARAKKGKEEEDERLTALEEANTKLAAALMVGLSKARAEQKQLLRRLEVAEAMSKDAQAQASDMEKLVQKYVNLNNELIAQNKQLKSQVTSDRK